MAALARAAVDRFAGMEAGRPGRRQLLRVQDPAPTSGRPAPRPDGALGAPKRGNWKGSCSPTSTAAVSSCCVNTSKPRSAGGSWPTGAPKPWPGRCGGPCPKTSTSCTWTETSWPPCSAASNPWPASWPCTWPANAANAAEDASISGPPCAGPCPTAGAPAEPVFRAPHPLQARAVGTGRHIRVRGRLRPLHPAAGLRPVVAVFAHPRLGFHRRHRRGDRPAQGLRRHQPRRCTT